MHKITQIKKNINQQNNLDINVMINKKVCFYREVIQKTLIHVQKNKILDILAVSDVVICLDKLNELSKKINTINTSDTASLSEPVINTLQTINNDLSSLIKNYGTECLMDLLIICFGNNKLVTDENDLYKYELLQKYFHPTSYKLVDEINNKKNKIKNEDVCDKTNIRNLDCFDVSTNYKQFHMKVQGIKIYMNNDKKDKGMFIYGILDEVNIDFLNNNYIANTRNKIKEFLPNDEIFKNDNFNYFLCSLMLKDYLIYNYSEIYNKYVGYYSQSNNIKQKSISQTVKDFISDDIFMKRMTLIQLLINTTNKENQYLAYLLYDLLSNDTNGAVDTQEQTVLFDSLPWIIKKNFLYSMKNTVQYTNELTNVDINKIPLEQQICLMKAPECVKEKAMLKLKEVKSKSEDSGSKARQYLEGLLRIPFGVYKREPILDLMTIIKTQFKNIYKNYHINQMLPQIPAKDKYTSIEIMKYLKIIENKFILNNYHEKYGSDLKVQLINNDKQNLIDIIIKINGLININKVNTSKIVYSNKKKDALKEDIEKFIDFCVNEKQDLLSAISKFLNKNKHDNVLNLDEIKNDISLINNNLVKISDYINDIKETLDKAVYGHDNAKKQIERIIAQWINGEATGYCFGLCGPPGVGKTSLIKEGLAKCLKDENGLPRPFSIIQLGGDANGSTLHGHNYTYVGSQHGSIVQILMDKKCMNPIILFDEVDKISKTEHGKEITGILTHLLDSTQNDCFQDKYFSGIDIDLSKALFILSYNDAELIDKILLDRVHKIKFNNLSLDEKIVICNKHLLPEIYKKTGLVDIINFSDETLKFLIEEYTLESGVRKLKEILYEIVSEINLDILKNNNTDYELPILITIDDIKNRYFKDKRVANVPKIHSESKVGVINALWASSGSEQGGVLPLQASFVPSNRFLELVLTGSIGDVMKESISVSLTNAWNLTSNDVRKELISKYNNPKNNEVYGIHINCAGLSVKKEGPSATTAFTVLIYSLFNNKKIKNYFGITGETSFDYCLSEIGGLQAKIINSIPSGVKEFIFPTENQKDFEKIMEKYKDKDIIKGIKFHAIDKVEKVFELILEEE